MQQDYVRGGTQKQTYTETEACQWICPLCEGKDSRLIKRERGVLGVVECSGCSLIRINPRLHHPEKIYQGNAEIYAEEFRLVRSGDAPHHRDKNYLADLRWIEKYNPSGNFLDVGTNTGSFLRLARGRQWNLKGVEPSPQLGRFAREWWGLDIIEGFLEKVDLPSRSFDVITLTDVFEHVVNPKEVLTTVRRLLKPTGIVLIKVPNAKFNLLKYYLRTKLGRPSDNDFDAYEHVVHYTSKTLRQMLEACGLDPVEMRVEPPVQMPVWHKLVGHYFQHASPFWLDWKTYTSRNLCYWTALAEYALTRDIGYFAPNIGCIARPKGN